MITRRRLLALSPLLCLVLAAVPRTAGHDKRSELKSFYIALHGTSDFLPAWYEAIIDVEPQGKDLRVRLIMITAASYTCGGKLVRARECIMPNLTMRELVGRADPCQLTAYQVQKALDAAKPKYMGSLEENHTTDVVATCGSRQRILSFPYTIEVDINKLHRQHPRVYALWNLNSHVRDRAFGKNFWLENVPAADEKKYEDLGTALLPDLRSGKYDAGFDDPCTGPKCGPSFLVSLLRGYTGPPANPDPSYVELEDASSLDLAKYVAPQFPAILKIAHGFGEVRLRVVADPRTGTVTDAKLMSGNAMLGHMATKAARQWQFVPRSGLDASLDVGLNFHLCGQ